eukprot:scaffold33028_cov32-Tisochrysis_lutea.AAC.3
MAFMLSRQGVRPDIDEELDRLMDGSHLPEHYQELARDLDLLEPKTPDDIYKTHLEKRPASAAAVDSARANLASTFVNAFVNLGFGSDKLMLVEGNKWLYKNKEHGMTSAAASLGALLAWDVDGGLTQIDKFLYMSDNNIKVCLNVAPSQPCKHVETPHGRFCVANTDFSFHFDHVAFPFPTRRALFSQWASSIAVSATSATQRSRS